MACAEYQADDCRHRRDDQEFSRKARTRDARSAKAATLRIVYDKSYPPSTTDYAPIVSAIAATIRYIVVVAQSPDSVGIVRAVNEIGFKTEADRRRHGRSAKCVDEGSAWPCLKTARSNYDFWLPVPSAEDEFPGWGELMREISGPRSGGGRRPLGYYIAPQAYAQMQVLQQACRGHPRPQRRTSLPAKSADTTFKTGLG